MNAVVLPVRVQHDPSARGGVSIKKHGTDAGWSTIACSSVEQAREIMAAYPGAAMPCWRNPRAVWNQSR